MRWLVLVTSTAWALAFSGCSLLKPNDPAQAGAPASIRLEVLAPPPLRALLEQHLDLSRLANLRDDEALDDTEWARLVAAAPAQARELLQTEGYFDPTVTVRREAGTPSRVIVRVEPGPRTLVASLKVTLAGELASRVDAGDADAKALRAQLDAAGPAVVGAAFRNTDWRDTKIQWLTRLRAAGYAAASLETSLADVDPARQRAELSAALASGPLFRAGPLMIEGLQHQDAETVRHLAGFGLGAPLTETRLLDYQDRLQRSGLFDAITIAYEPELAQAGAAPVRVRLHELPLQQAQFGVGYSANTGPRASVEHTHRRPFDLAFTAHNKLEWGRDAQRWSGDFTGHPGEDFSRNLIGVQIERLKSDTDTVLSQRLRLGRSLDTPRLERLLFAEALRSRQSDGGGLIADARALSLNANFVLRDLDSVLLPTRGYSLTLEGGAGRATSLSAPSGPFGRMRARLTTYVPFGADWYGQARIEAGQIIKRDEVVVPDALGFRAGGDDSVRGYAYRTLAPVVDGNTVSGNVLFTASAEVARPISASMPSLWGALFVDVGRAAQRWGDVSPAVGYGVGLRWRSPIGPLRADLAWGQELHKARLHLSVGIAF
ncbi:MAG: BamA/TamA family outer membrane protein [Burkholderiales bacterium]|nr:BamA/TamA family outer membrane protein [Burkholderiales bacterium]